MKCGISREIEKIRKTRVEITYHSDIDDEGQTKGLLKDKHLWTNFDT